MGKLLDSLRTRFRFGEPLSDYEQRIVSNVAEHGWFKKRGQSHFLDWRRSRRSRRP
jgi:hypothetical protein